MRALDLDGLLSKTASQRRQYAAILESEFKTFCKWAFFLMDGAEFQWTTVHELKADTLALVEAGKIKRLIINEPPRFSKTEEVSILWPLWSIIKNPRCKFFVISGSDTLVQDASGRVRSFLERPEVALLWPHVQVKQDAKSKEHWRTDAGGAFRATSLGGQVTGFGGGVFGSRVFAGALILDDLLKAQESLNINRMETVNGIYTRVIKNRVNDKDTPIVVLAQRLHDADICGYLLGGGSGEKWHHLRIPGAVLSDEEEAAAERYSRDWNYGIPLHTSLPKGFVWPDKYDSKIDKAWRVDMDSWATQVIQNPRITAGSLLRTSWLRRYDNTEISGGFEGFVHRENQKIRLSQFVVYSDTAETTKTASDYTVFQLWGLGVDKNIYLLDQLRGKWEVPDLQRVAMTWLEKYEAKAPRRYGWRYIRIENKSSGRGLNQALARKWGAHVKPIERNIDKVSRALHACLPLEAGRVWVPKAAPWMPDFVAEYAAFNKQMTHLHDDQLDPMFDAIEDLIGAGGSLYDVIK